MGGRKRRQRRSGGFYVTYVGRGVWFAWADRTYRAGPWAPHARRIWVLQWGYAVEAGGFIGRTPFEASYRLNRYLAELKGAE